jgi:hypothetical protein
MASSHSAPKSDPLAGMAHSEAHYFNRWAFLLHDSQHHLGTWLADRFAE